GGWSRRDCVRNREERSSWQQLCLVESRRVAIGGRREEAERFGQPRQRGTATPFGQPEPMLLSGSTTTSIQAVGSQDRTIQIWIFKIVHAVVSLHLCHLLRSSQIKKKAFILPQSWSLAC
ncbi:unnamed protein product, partial [Musa acuminata subsp. burmannicoides]